MEAELEIAKNIKNFSTSTIREMENKWDSGE